MKEKIKLTTREDFINFFKVTSQNNEQNILNNLENLDLENSISKSSTSNSLHYAVRFSTSAVVKKTSELAKSQSIKLNLEDKQGYTPLHHAGSNRSITIEAIKALVDNGADIYAAKNKYKDTPLHYACKAKNSNVNLIEYCIDNHTNLLTQINRSDLMPLHEACDKSYSKKVVELLLPHSYLCTDRNTQMPLPLYKACLSKNINSEIIEFLVDKYPLMIPPRMISQGWDANSGGTIGNKTVQNPWAYKSNPLHLLCANEHASFDKIEYLVKKYPEFVKLQDYETLTPVWYLFNNNNIEAIKIFNLLIDNGATISLRHTAYNFLHPKLTSTTITEINHKLIKLFFDHASSIEQLNINQLLSYDKEHKAGLFKGFLINFPKEFKGFEEFLLNGGKGTQELKGFKEFKEKAKAFMISLKAKQKDESLPKTPKVLEKLILSFVLDEATELFNKINTKFKSDKLIKDKIISFNQPTKYVYNPESIKIISEKLIPIIYENSIETDPVEAFRELLGNELE